MLLLAAIALVPACARPLPVAQRSGQVTAAATTPLDYGDYANLLQTYVSPSGLVDYTALQANPDPLQAVVAELGAVSLATYEGWSEADKIAFLINAYNAITLQSIVDQAPLKPSIRDIPGVWTAQRHPVLGQALTLDNLEHDLLRKQFSEPRVHAALVCAAISCPPLRQEPFTGDRLDQQLNDQAQRWLDSPQGLSLDRDQNRVAISSIFKWFGEDWQTQYAAPDQFTGSPKERAVLNFIGNYVSPSDRAYLAEGNYRLDYLDYDWSLNKQ
jgi:hypothetical protein